ncbi:hypothetical protein [Photorhabdus stackebrandtii]|uniref:Uncharacterized protein n=1 Tax=Photorhabdus stackebrandtii TaxID=1123042 RepID=A0A7X5QLP3_9GAMM|nr:hypothetical protein [Photorhabdus stackebrandtii]NHB96474.1 hypothetical protein [Photorhabdus stackebrandtii]
MSGITQSGGIRTIQNKRHLEWVPQIDDNAEAALENTTAHNADKRYQQQVSSQFENTNSSILDIKESVSKLNESTAKDINQVKA